MPKRIDGLTEDRQENAKDLIIVIVGFVAKILSTKPQRLSKLEFVVSELENHGLKVNATDTAILAKIDARWTSNRSYAGFVEPSPFDRVFKAPSRIVYYLDIPNWEFHKKMFALKDHKKK